ncbi:TMEM1 family protein-like protein [Lentithecium fluviatile CBS 122367]|uniref:TMEM1 family protein-like protein n=1 Tax=Lentithecium fluviatile CBS 122367 TaxID=1168545 RepID=A0A6G1JE22_9PLEO|nr:TMEM1 family protein-like protein [Lentithecium fluviatile CBS 122367]
MSGAGNGAPVLGDAEIASGQKQPEQAIMDGLSSSKVTVEYHDPAGVFSLVQDQLAARLPLKNLHWKSPTRPLRSIDSLHVDLVPSADSVHISGVTSPGLAPPGGERRHQIPGLRQTPYLKVYLLRCDDSDTYKSTARKQLREWVKAHTPPSQSSSSASMQENHDAFEWMIIHVVIPDTPAASQPRGSASAAAGEKEKTSAVSRFTRGTTTILEKIRADFNSASKSAPDRVAQVRLPKETVPPHMLPATASVTSPPITESPQEQERAWNEVITRFKMLILLSFDLRVSQYEEDIREKDSQRALPGWNFCTFFILKEGLARGFESVGLVEDALLGYDELSVGLDTIIRDQAVEGSNAQGGVLLHHTEELYEKAAEILKESERDEETSKDTQPRIHNDNPINAKKKDYRGLILSNNISIFDFRSYIFARQMSLLLRLGNSLSARSDLASKLQPRPNAGVLQRSVDDSGVGTKSGGAASDSEDLLSLAELCTRALNFITFAGRLLRDDLVNGAKAHNVEFPERLIDNTVRSWTFAALEQILRETSTSSLPFTKYVGGIGTGSSSKMLPFGNSAKEQKIAVSEPKSMIHPTRSSSLNAGRSSSADPPYAQPPPSGQVVFENGQYQDRPAPTQDSSIPPPKTGLQELAAARAQLLVVQRRISEHIGRSFGWSIGWAAVLISLNPKEELTDVDINEKDDSDEEGTKPEQEVTHTTPTFGLSAAAIVGAVSSLDRFRQFYETLSDLIVKHYMAAGQTKSGESILGDLAALRFELGDYAAAAMYFGRMASLFAETRWNTVETTMLKMYAQCLKKLNRRDEYVRTLLDLLAKSAASRLSIRPSSKRANAVDTSQMPNDWLNDDNVDTTGVFAQLIHYSQQLPYDKNAPMAKYFSDIVVEPYVRHFDDKDGFQLRLQFRHILEDDIELDQARVRLISATSAQGKEIWLESSVPIKVTKGLCRVWLSSNANTVGPFMVDKIVLRTKRIAFVHEPFIKAEATTPLGIITSAPATSIKVAKKSRILCFPRVEALQAHLYLSHFIHIDKPRHIEIKCTTGWNEIQRAEIRLKSGSAGLRLRTANAASVSADVKITDRPSPGILTIGDIPADTVTTFKVPYETETVLPDLTVKLEIDYYTEHGQFQYHSIFTIPVELPLDVNVHDHFKNASLFSKFNIKTASQVPLEIIGVSLEGSGEYEVAAPRKSPGPLHAFPKQPVAMTYKIMKKATEAAKRRQSQAPGIGKLSLSVEYRCLDEDVLDRARALFANAVEHSPVRRLARLLIETFADRLEHRVLPHQYEKIALLEKVDLGPFDDMGWSECLESLPHIVRDDTRTWLQKWHESHRSILLPKACDLASPAPSTAPPSPHPPRRMIITVSIPQTHILHTASLSLTSLELSSSQGTTIAVVGHPLMTELRIKHTRRWGSPSSLVAAANLSSPSDPIEFVYTLEANPETWLVAGQRRAHFTTTEDEEHKFPMMLIPLKAGTLLLPNVEIRARIKPKGEDKRQSVAGSVSVSVSVGDDEEQLNCETDYLSYGECVMVVPDVRSSTVGIGEMGSPRSAVWLEAESRC